MLVLSTSDIVDVEFIVLDKLFEDAKVFTRVDMGEESGAASKESEENAECCDGFHFVN